MTTRAEWIDLSGDEELLFMDGLDDAIIGVGNRCGQEGAVVVYDVEKVYRAYREQGMSHAEAVEWAETNAIGAWVGDCTPMWVDTGPLVRG